MLRCNAPLASIPASNVWQKLDDIARRIQRVVQKAAPAQDAVVAVQGSQKSEKMRTSRAPEAKLSDKEVAKLLTRELRLDTQQQHKKQKRTGSQAQILETKTFARMDHLRKQGNVVGIASHNAALSIFSRAGMHVQAMRLASGMTKKDITTYNTLLHSAAKTNAAADFLALWRQLCERQNEPSPPVRTTHTYTAALLFIRSGQSTHEDFQRRYKNISRVVRAAYRANNNRHSPHILNNAIGACTTLNDADKIFRFMHNQTDVLMDAFTLKALLAQCGANVTRASSYFQESISHNVVLSVNEWTALLRVFKSANDVIGMQKVWKGLAESCSPILHSYVTFVEGCVASGNVQAASEKYAEAVKRGLKDRKLQSAMLAVYRTAGDTEGANTLKRAISSSGYVVAPQKATHA